MEMNGPSLSLPGVGLPGGGGGGLPRVDSHVGISIAAYSCSDSNKCLIYVWNVLYFQFFSHVHVKVMY